MKQDWRFSVRVMEFLRVDVALRDVVGGLMISLDDLRGLFQP